MELDLILTELRPFKLVILAFFCTVEYDVFVTPLTVSQTLKTYCEHIEDAHVGFVGDKINFDGITAFYIFGSFLAL